MVKNSVTRPVTLVLPIIIELFWKKLFICQWCERMYLCGFVTLYVRIFVARANKVEGTISWCLGTNEILAST